MRIVDALDHAFDRTTDGVEFGQTGGIGAFVALQPQFVALLRVEPFEQGLETGLRGESVFIGIKAIDRKSVVSGKSVSVRVDLGGSRIIKKKIETKGTVSLIYQH